MKLFCLFVIVGCVECLVVNSSVFCNFGDLLMNGFWIFCMCGVYLGGVCNLSFCVCVLNYMWYWLKNGDGDDKLCLNCVIYVVVIFILLIFFMFCI